MSDTSYAGGPGGGPFVSPNAGSVAARGGTWSWGCSNYSSGANTRYIEPWYDGAAAATTTIGFNCPYDCTVSNLYHRCRNPVANGNSVVFTLLVNNVATALSLTIASTDQDGANTVDSVDVDEGDFILMEKFTALSIGSTPDDVLLTMRVVPR